MRQFKDKNGRDWSIEVNLVTKRNVLTATGGKVNLFGAVDESFQQAIGEDPELLVKTLFVLCAEQAEKDKIEYDAFMRGFDGDLLESANDVLLEAIADFFPKSRRLIIQATAKKRKEVEAAVMATATDKINAINPSEFVQTMLNASAIKEQASSASNPDAALSAS